MQRAWFRKALTCSFGHDQLDLAASQTDVLELVVIEGRQGFHVAPDLPR
jgi:hypothetical protein